MGFIEIPLLTALLPNGPGKQSKHFVLLGRYVSLKWKMGIPCTKKYSNRTQDSELYIVTSRSFAEASVKKDKEKREHVKLEIARAKNELKLSMICCLEPL